jgi:hypothetical protein
MQFSFLNESGLTLGGLFVFMLLCCILIIGWFGILYKERRKRTFNFIHSEISKSKTSNM